MQIGNKNQNIDTSQWARFDGTPGLSFQDILMGMFQLMQGGQGVGGGQGEGGCGARGNSGEGGTCGASAGSATQANPSCGDASGFPAGGAGAANACGPASNGWESSQGGCGGFDAGQMDFATSAGGCGSPCPSAMSAVAAMSPGPGATSRGPRAAVRDAPARADRSAAATAMPRATA